MAPIRQLFAEIWNANWDGFDISHSPRDGSFGFALRRTASEDIDWAKYTREFSSHALLHADPALIGGSDAGLLDRLGPATGELVTRATEIMRRGRHELVTLRSSRRLGMGVLLCRHSSLRGEGNGLHIVAAGGIRRHELDDGVGEVVLDGLNLARAMTYKNAGAAIPAGGCKLILCSDPLDASALEDLGFVAWCIDESRTMTGPDIGLSPAHADALSKHFTRNITGGHKGIPTGTPTGYGVTLAIEVVLRRLRNGQPRWPETTVGVQGLGAVGGTVAQQVLSRGGRVVVADVAHDRVKAFLATARSADSRVRVVEPDQILTADVDVLVPAAVGGVVTESVIRELRCSALVGAANNVLTADAPAEELRLAEQLHERGILFLIDWQVNVGGVLAGYEQWQFPEAPSIDRLHRAIELRCTDGIDELLNDADAHDETPTATSYRWANQALGYAS